MNSPLTDGDVYRTASGLEYHLDCGGNVYEAVSRDLQLVDMCDKCHETLRSKESL